MQVTDPLMSTLLRSGQVKFLELWMLTFPLTSERLGNSTDSKFPVISTFPLTAFND